MMIAYIEPRFKLSYSESLPLLSFIEPISAWNVPLVSLIFLKRSIVFPILVFSSISFHWSLRKAFLSLLDIHPYRYHKACRVQDCAASGQTTNREGAQAHPSAENWIKDLLSMALTTRAIPSLPHSQSLPSRSLHKPLILIHQRAERRSKNYNPTDSRTKVTITKLTKMNIWITASCNSMKLWSMSCRGTQCRRVVV